MKTIQRHSRPSYYATAYIYDQAHPEAGQVRPGWFKVFEHSRGKDTLLFCAKKEEKVADILDECHKRGIPFDEARCLADFIFNS